MKFNCCKKKSEEFPIPTYVTPKQKMSAGTKACIGISLVAIGTIALLAIVILAHQGMIPGSAHTFMKHTLTPWLHNQAGPWCQSAAHSFTQAMQSSVPSWSIPVALGGLALLGAGAYKIHSNRARQKRLQRIFFI